jgi:hypothetical protein
MLGVGIPGEIIRNDNKATIAARLQGSKFHVIPSQKRRAAIAP